MTHILATTIVLTLACLVAVFLPAVRRRLGGKADAVQRVAFAVLVAVLWVFSLHETIKETGMLYGVLFSMIPLVAGAVLWARMKPRKS